MRPIWRLFPLVLLLTLGIACTDSTGPVEGKEGGPCYPNKTCEPRLTCLSGRCVRLPDASRKDGPAADIMGIDKSIEAGSPDSGVPGKWISIPAGKFKMGAPVGGPCKETLPGIKETQHTVTLTHKFEMQEKEVTQAEYMTLMGSNPSYIQSCGTDCPVEKTTWHMAAAYCNALSKKASLVACYACTGKEKDTACMETAATQGKGIYTCKGYRLPTEAEWEYAYRAGTTTTLYNGALDATKCNTINADTNADKIGWYLANASKTSHPVGVKQPNALGLYDMAGNIYEWCHDWFQTDLGSSATIDPVGPTTGTEKVIRGGSWQNISKHMRAANRNKITATQQSPYAGLRCVRTR